MWNFAGSRPLRSGFVCILLLLAPIASRAGEVKKLTYDDGKKSVNGEERPTLKLQSDDTVVVRLQENPGNGFHWIEASDTTKILERVSMKLEPSKEPVQGVGGGSQTRVFTFKPKPNDTVIDQPQYLKLILVQGKGKQAYDTFKVPIVSVQK